MDQDNSLPGVHRRAELYLNRILGVPRQLLPSTLQAEDPACELVPVAVLLRRTAGRRLRLCDQLGQLLQQQADEYAALARSLEAQSLEKEMERGHSYGSEVAVRVPAVLRSGVPQLAAQRYGQLVGLDDMLCDMAEALLAAGRAQGLVPAGQLVDRQVRVVFEPAADSGELETSVAGYARRMVEMGYATRAQVWRGRDVVRDEIPAPVGKGRGGDDILG